MDKMPSVLMLVPVGEVVDLPEISRALVKALLAQNIAAKFLQFIDEHKKSHILSIHHVEHLLAEDAQDEALEEIFARYVNLSKDVEVVVINGLHCWDKPYLLNFNTVIAKALNAQVIIVANTIRKYLWLNERIRIITHLYNQGLFLRVLGYITSGKKYHKNVVQEIKHIVHLPKKKFSQSKNKYIEFIATKFPLKWLQEVIATKYPDHTTSARFRYLLIKQARKACKKIILPEAEDPRILRAAQICYRRNLANCVLLGDKKEIYHVAAQHKIHLNEKIIIINPKDVIDQYVEPLYELRKEKGMTKELAAQNLQDNNILALMMLKQKQADGVVSGATHTTAETIRPAFQIIKTAPEFNLASSVMFMCLPEQVLVFADCAINPNPNAQQLADIAIESARTAQIFGIEPRVAMLSYATGSSAHGSLVDKVRDALGIVRNKYPDIPIDGPLQYDAAVIKEVAERKAPTSLIAGNATVCIFPDLNVGNIVYKAVQRSAHILAIGPLLQGLNQPVSDLSRGCSVKDIVFTIAVIANEAGDL